MKSTGEVMGIDKSFLMAFIKSQIATGTNLPKQGKVFLSIDDNNKNKLLDIAKKLELLNFELIATKGTSLFLEKNGIKVIQIKKVREGSPHIVESMLNGDIDLVINTTKTQSSIRDSYSIRRTALMINIPYYTTIAGAKVAVDAIEALKKEKLTVRSLQSIH